MKKTRIVTLLMLSAIFLTGCGNKATANGTASHKAKTNTVKVTKKSKVTKKVAASKKSQALWYEKKDGQLKSFIDQWAPTMKQSYVKYDGKNSLKVSTGMVYPDDLSKVNVEGRNSSIGWNKDGVGNYTYNVVAIYNYDGTVPPLPNHITYFFAFKNGQPIVLVDQSRDGTPNLIETQNTKLKSAFSEIVTNKFNDSQTSSADDTKSKSTTELTSDPKLVGVMVHQLVMPGDNLSQEAELAVYTHGGRYWIGTGTSVSNVGYTIEGNNVNYWTRDINSGDSTATQSYIEHTISLADLENQYYSTNDQKQTVQDVANKMPDIDED